MQLEAMTSSENAALLANLLKAMTQTRGIYGAASSPHLLNRISSHTAMICYGLSVLPGTDAVGIGVWRVRSHWGLAYVPCNALPQPDCVQRATQFGHQAGFLKLRYGAKNLADQNGRGCVFAEMVRSVGRPRPSLRRATYPQLLRRSHSSQWTACGWHAVHVFLRRIERIPVDAWRWVNLPKLSFNWISPAKAPSVSARTKLSVYGSAPPRQARGGPRFVRARACGPSVLRMAELAPFPQVERGRAASRTRLPGSFITISAAVMPVISLPSNSGQTFNIAMPLVERNGDVDCVVSADRYDFLARGLCAVPQIATSTQNIR
jgi:hypothetical protein